ncbi:ABC-2 family transporter protein [Candidatus Daviesbacteria bacterium]|nr:ABC-2 family transporter protein [Candidatus Daviesbacteria bacterium]
MREFKIWIKYTINSFEQTLYNKMSVVIFLLGKFLRITLFLIFLNFLVQGSKGLAGYSREQIIFFYLSFNLADSAAQLLFREVYRFRELIVSGNFDFVLARPLNPLIRVLLGGADILDLFMLILITFFSIWFAAVSFHPSISQWLFYALMVLNGLLIAAAFHIFVLGIGILTTSIDHLIMVYRDLSSMARIPVDIYIEPIRSLLTFAIPLGIMMTFPPKALMGLLSGQFIAVSIIIGLALLFLSLKFWSYSLKQYQSTSS